MRPVLLVIRSTRDNRRGPLYMEQVLAVLHQSSRRRTPVRFLVGRQDDSVGVFIDAPNEQAQVVRQSLQQAYPDCRIESLSGSEALSPSDKRVSSWAMQLRLSRDIFPIRRHTQFDDRQSKALADPLTGLLTAVTAKPGDPTWARIELTVVPARRLRRWFARRAAKKLDRQFFRSYPTIADLYAGMKASRSSAWWLLSALVGLLAPRDSGTMRIDSTSQQGHTQEDDVQAAMSKIGRHLFETQIQLVVYAPREHRRPALQKLRDMAGAFGPFTCPRLATFRCSAIRRWTPKPLRDRGFLLSDEELATLWHPPTEAVRVTAMQSNESRDLEPPTALRYQPNETNVANLGRLKFRGEDDIFGIRRTDRRRHLYVVGKTGMGKSTLLCNQFLDDVRAGEGAGLIDPHGDLAEKVIEGIPSGRRSDLVILNAGESQWPVSYNPLDCRGNAEHRARVAAAVLTAIKNIYEDVGWGARLENTLRNTLLALVEVPGTTLLSIERMLTCPLYRQDIVDRVTDDYVRSFWNEQFARWSSRYRKEAIPPILNKTGQFLSSPLVRNVLCQSRRSIDLRRIMDEGKILVVNLAKGKLGEEESNLLGSLLVTGIQQAAMQRADVVEDDRRDFYLYVDEFQNFATDSFATILSEARKYRLNLIVAHQYLSQLSDATRDAVFGNTGSMVAFQVGPDDAEILAQQLSKTPGDVLPQDLANLPKYIAYVRLLIDGIPSRAFSMETLAPDHGVSIHQPLTVSREMACATKGVI